MVGKMGDSSLRPILSRLATLSENRTCLFHCPDIALRESAHLLCLGHEFIFELVLVTGGRYT